MHWKLIATKTGQMTVLVEKEDKTVLLHSKYDPVKEAERWVASSGLDADYLPERMVVLGLGAGYHVEQLHQVYPKLPIVVWDFNCAYVKWLRQVGRLDQILACASIELCVTENLAQIKSQLLPLLDQPGCAVLVHFPSLELIPEQLGELKASLEEYVLFLRTVRKNSELLNANFDSNLHLGDPGITEWLKSFRDQPAILVSAGPSLNKQLFALSNVSASRQIRLCCVGTALTPLLAKGIKPDLVMISDPLEVICQQFDARWDYSDLPLFYLSTANHQAVATYSGPRWIVWQQGFERAEKQARLKGEPLIQTGGSVSTSLLDFLITLGCSSIALVGQDLAYTDGQTHAEGTHDNRTITGNYDYQQVLDYYERETVPTSKNLLSYLRWFEKYARDGNVAGRLWNCTEGGAHIQGFVHQPLAEFIRKNTKH